MQQNLASYCQNGMTILKTDDKSFEKFAHLSNQQPARHLVYWRDDQLRMKTRLHEYYEHHNEKYQCQRILKTFLHHRDTVAHVTGE